MFKKPKEIEILRERALKRLKKKRDLDGDEMNSNHKIWKILKKSFDNLKVKVKNMFLDIYYLFGSDVYF